MKKPDLTEGEWQIRKEAIHALTLYLIDAENGEAIHDSFNEANAKAISAVPEMIDLLIELHGAIDSLPEYSLGSIRSAEHEQDYPAEMKLKSDIKHVLEKAGVEYE